MCNKFVLSVNLIAQTSCYTLFLILFMHNLHDIFASAQLNHVAD